jgi:transposase
MGRKKGVKNGSTDLKAALMAEKVINEHKTVAEAAKEVGVHASTGSRLLHRAMADSEVRSRIQRSRDRVIKMLSLADNAFLKILKHDDPVNYGNQLKAAQSIYRTMGVLTDQPIMSVNHVTPIKVEVENKVYNIGAGDPDKASS